MSAADWLGVWREFDFDRFDEEGWYDDIFAEYHEEFEADFDETFELLAETFANEGIRVR